MRLQKKIVNRNMKESFRNKMSSGPNFDIKNIVGGK